MKRINFKKQTNKSYKKVQESINDSIVAHLGKEEYVKTPLYHPKCINLTYFIRQEADVLMSHGVADKNYLSMRVGDERMLNKFQHVFVPGPWLKSKILNTDGIRLREDQVHEVGWPRLDSMLNQRATFLNTRDKSASIQNVLWAPTHDNRKRGKEKESTSSYPKFGAYSYEMSKAYDYRVALHPRNKKSKVPTGQTLVESDFVISDFGTMVYEAWALGIPVIFPRWILKDRIIKYVKGSAEAYIFDNNIGLHANDIDDVHRFISENRPIGDDVKKFMQEYLPDKYLGKSGELIASKLKSIEVKHSKKIFMEFYIKLIRKKLGI